jgi:hypothetical protein
MEIWFHDGFQIQIPFYVSNFRSIRKVKYCDFRIKLIVDYFMSNHHKIAPNTCNIVVYHLSIHHWQRDMIFLANT